MKVKESKKLDKNLDLVRELKNDMEPKSDTSDNWSPRNNPHCICSDGNRKFQESLVLNIFFTSSTLTYKRYCIGMDQGNLRILEGS